MKIYNFAKMRQQEISESDMEICVMCGKVTAVPVTEPLDKRVNYFPGAGQLCNECAIENKQEEKSAMCSGFMYAMPYYEKENNL